MSMSQALGPRYPGTTPTRSCTVPYHHLAVATRDMQAIHAFYTDAMGFALVKVQLGKTPEGGWAKHFFYQTGEDELMAFWEIHDETLPADFPTGLSEAAGLPAWANHVAFRASGSDDLEQKKQRWLTHGCDVVEIDHDWCYSIYTTDPNRTLVEFCITTSPFDETDRKIAHQALTRDDLEFAPEPTVTVHRANRTQR